MSYRSCPRAITFSSTANGKTVASRPSSLPVYSRTSSCSSSRATVPATGARAERPSAKNVDSRNGMYFGWSCMSCRHAEPASRSATTINAETAEFAEKMCSAGSASSAFNVVIRSLVRNGGHLPRPQCLEESPRLLQIEVRVFGLDAEEEPIAAGERESRDIEDGVIRHRQAVQRQHAEHGRQGRDEDRALEGDRDECGPAKQRSPPDVPRVLDGRHPILQGEPADTAHQATHEHDERQ